MDKDAAEAQIVEKQKIVDFDIKEFTIELLVSKYKNRLEEGDSDIYVPEYQRNFVWENDRQAKFIESVLLGLPIPYIFTADNEGRLEIVDGSQRIRTLSRYLDGDLKLQGLEVLTALNGFTFNDLSRARQRKIQNSTIRMIALSDKSDEEVRFMMFERINTGSIVLKDMEKRKGIFGGKFIDFVYDDCTKHPLFVKNTRFTDRLEKRGEPQELVVRFYAYSESYKNVKGGVNDFLNAFVKSKNKEFDRAQMVEEFDRMLRFVDEWMPGKFTKGPASEKTPRIRFDALAVGVNLALRERPDLVPKDLSWLDSSEFQRLVSGGGQNAPTAIEARIDFVKDHLLG